MFQSARVFVCFLLLGPLATGCLSRFRQAEELAAQKRYVEAAQVLEQLYAEDPQNSDIRRAMERVRFLAVEHALGQARVARFSGEPDASMRLLADGLALRKRWNVKLNGALESTIEDEREEATRRLRGQVVPLIQEGSALKAESIFLRHEFLLKHDEMSALSKEFREVVSKTGKATCVRLKKSVTTQEPFWTSLVAEYCRHFQQASPSEPALSGVSASVKSRVEISESGRGVTGALESVLTECFLKSPWHSPRGSATAFIQSDGAFSQTFRQQVVPMVAEWQENVPYQVQVKKILTDSVPVQECEVEESRNSEGQRSVRTREVTRVKQIEREVMVKETRFRSVPRTFAYSALRLDRVLSFSMRARLMMSDEMVVSSGYQDSDSTSGYEHDVKFEPAGIRPQRASFSTPESWLSSELGQTAKVFSQALFDGWRSRYCRSLSYTPEEAARCARAVTGIPTPAEEALRTRLMQDAEVASLLFQSQE